VAFLLLRLFFLPLFKSARPCLMANLGRNNEKHSKKLPNYFMKLWCLLWPVNTLWEPESLEVASYLLGSWPTAFAKHVAALIMVGEAAGIIGCSFGWSCETF
jgi:hypothetical protein